MQAMRWNSLSGWIGIGTAVIIGFFSNWGQAAPVGKSIESDRLSVIWNGSGSVQELKSWGFSELQKWRHRTSRERDPVTGRMVKWEGILLSQLIDQGLVNMPVEKRAQVDLLVLKSSSGSSTFLPRSFVSKYPIMLAFHWGRYAQEVGEIGQWGFISSLVPWSSNPKILNEDLPLEKFFVPQVVTVELTNYRDHYNFLFLKRRTDPSAMRGEKLVVQNCVSCHSMGRSPAHVDIAQEGKVKKFALEGHPAMHIHLKLTERDRKSIVQYLDAHRLENPLPVSNN